MYLIKVEEQFEAAHSIRGYNGKCARLHGHSWAVEAEVMGHELNSLGILVDFKDVKRELKAILERLDHEFLNEKPPFNEINPTAENLAKYVFDELSDNEIFDDNVKLSAITVWESPESSVRYSL